MNRIIEEIVTINTYGVIGELDINNMTKKFNISKNKNNNELFIKIEQQLSTLHFNVDRKYILKIKRIEIKDNMINRIWSIAYHSLNYTTIQRTYSQTRLLSF